MTLLQRMAWFARRRYYWVFLGMGIVVAVSIALAARLSFDTDMLKLLPRRDPAVAAYVETLERFGNGSVLIVAVRLPEGAVVEPYESLVDDLADRLRALPELKRVEHRLGEPSELLSTFFPKALLFLDEQGRRDIAARLSDESIRAEVAELRRRLGTPQGSALKALATIDPLGLSEVFLDRLQSSRGSLQVDWTSGYYLSKDHRLLLILAEPVRPPQDVKFCERLSVVVNREIAAALSQWPEIAGGDSTGGQNPSAPEIRLGGPYLTTLGDASLIRNDVIVNVVTSLLGVLILFLVAFRRLGSLFYALLPLACGILLTFGFAAVAVGSLSSATSGVAALLIGLGIDFVIVNYGRYVEARRRGVDLEGALAEMNGSSGRAVVTGAVTTAATFYAFTFTDFVGLRQLGLLAGSGILFCLGSILILLPAILAWRDDHHAKRRSEAKLVLYAFGTKRLMRFAFEHPRVVLGLGSLITAASLLGAFGLKFDESMKTMRPQGNAGMEATEEVGKRFGSGFDSMTLVLEGKTLDEVLELTDRAALGARRLVASGVLQGYSGVDSLIPPKVRQDDALAWLARERAGSLDLGRIQKTFETEAAAQGLRAEGFAPGFELLGRAIALDGPVGVADFQSSRQTQVLLDRYLAKTERGWTSALVLYPPSNKWRRQAPPEAIALAAELGPRAILTGVNVINQRVRKMVLRDAWIAGILGYLAVAFLVWLDFRSLRLMFLALAPLSVGIVWMMGGMALFGIQMNFINIFVTTMIIGIGVDYGVHIIHRYRESLSEPREDRERALFETGGAVVVAALSTIVGFGSITFSHYPGLRTVGMVAILGAMSTCLVAITLLPAFFAWQERGARGAD